MNECKRCGNPIVGRTKRAIFCGYSCKEAWFLEASKAATVVRLAGRICRSCGGPIQSGSGKAICCSKTCSVAYQNAKRRTIQLADWNARKKPCPRCGGEVPESRWGALYCSAQCKKLEMDARWRVKSPSYNRKRLYGITSEEYNALLEKQDGRCAICRVDSPGGKGSWHVDHDHSTEAIRGLLCNDCNLGLGKFADDPARLLAAVAYLG